MNFHFLLYFKGGFEMETESQNLDNISTSGEKQEKQDSSDIIKEVADIPAYEPHPTKEQLNECKLETIEHIENVRKYIRVCIDKLSIRGVEHDKSKLVSPEVEYFAEVNDTLKNLSYGSEEYYDNLKRIAPALEHHYSRNSHHPEHHANGVKDMTLIDVLEMICDWKASSLRQNDGNLLKNIDLNTQRFRIDKQLKQIIINTVKMFEEIQ